jgi:hypothetical protein
MNTVTIEQVHKLHDEIRSGRITRESLQAFLENPSGANGNLFTVTIDYSRTLDEMIAAGRYDWKSSDITATHFPIDGSGTVEAKVSLVRIGRYATTREVEKHLDGLGLKSARIEHLLAFGKRYPDKQRECQIVALGSAWEYHPGYCVGPFLVGDAESRHLNVNWIAPGLGWDECCHFLAFPK